jgi:hypothetical protein
MDATFALRALVAVILTSAVPPAIGQGQLIVNGSPQYVAATGNGFKSGEVEYDPGSAVNNHGAAVGMVWRYASGVVVDANAVRWGGEGAENLVLGNLGVETGTDVGGTWAYAINDANTAVGGGIKYNAGLSVGQRAIRWEGPGIAAIELGNIGTDADGVTAARAQAVNSAGTSVGWASKYTAAGSHAGIRAVRWDSSGTAATELDGLGADTSGNSDSEAFDVNDSGVAVGYSEKYVAGSYVRHAAVRWDGSGTAATELDGLGSDGSDFVFSKATDVNNAGTAVGVSSKYDLGVYKGQRAVRWDAEGTSVTELGHLGVNVNGHTNARALALNESGASVGYSDKYVSGSYVGSRAVRWDSSGAEATELENLGTDSHGRTSSSARAVNEAGTVAGNAQKHGMSPLPSYRAVMWLPDASIIDLNELGVLPSSDGGTWLLREANAMSRDGWLAGEGTFTPAIGAAYSRHWVAQIGLGGEWTGEYTGSLDGTWGRGPQWSTGTPAMQVGDAMFSASSSYTVSLDRHERTRTIAVSAGEVELDFNGFTLESIQGMTVSGSAKFMGAGTIIGNVSLAQSGTLAPGVSPGKLNVNGNYVMDGGTLEIELGGAAAGHFDQLSVTGDVALNGKLDLKLLGSFAPTVGQAWEIIDVGGSMIGHFAGLAQDAPIANIGGTILSISYSGGDGNDVVITTAAGLLGDFDIDGDVDGADFLAWQRGESPLGVDATDLVDWQANFGNSSPASANSVSVPEPSTAMLIIMMAIGSRLRPRWTMRRG